MRPARRAILALAGLLCFSSPLLAADAAKGPMVERIGIVEVRTPGCVPDQPCRHLHSPEKVRAWLRGFVGKPCDFERIHRKIDRRYAALGYRPRIRIGVASGALEVSIEEAPAVIGTVTVDQEKAAASLPPGLLDSLPPIERPHVLMNTVRTHPGDLVNRERMMQDRYDLGLLGYDLVPVRPAPVAPAVPPGEGKASVVGVTHEKASGGDISPEGREETDGEIAAVTSANGIPLDYVITRRPPRGLWRKTKESIHIQRPVGLSGGRVPEAEPENTPSTTGEAVAGDDDRGPNPMPIGPLQKRWLSGSAEYSRRSLFSARLFYQRAHLFREFDLVEISPYVSQQAAGAIAYTLPYLLPAHWTTWNVFTELKLYDEFTPDRLLGGTEMDGVRVGAVEADEERRGGRFTLGVEPFRHLNGHSLKGSAYVNRFHVSFSGCTISVNCDDAAAGKARVPGSRVNDLNILGVSLDYGYQHLFRSPRVSWRFLPTAEVATRARGGDLSFRRVFGELQQHYWFGSGIEIDARWKAGIVDRRVPIYEQFALGGADSIRGFLRDDFIGRRFASAQHDIWIPIPFRAMGRNSSILGALERNLKTAITLDGGSVSFDDVVSVRVARGIGVGLRYQSEGSPLVVRLDAAYGYFDGTSQWYPYLSFTRKW